MRAGKPEGLSFRGILVPVTPGKKFGPAEVTRTPTCPGFKAGPLPLGLLRDGTEGEGRTPKHLTLNQAALPICLPRHRSGPLEEIRTPKHLALDQAALLFAYEWMVATLGLEPRH